MADNFDKFYPDWVVGTLTLVSGSRNFTATNAQLTLAAIREGDTIITPSGLTLPIESINANGNGGVLAQNAPAAAAGTYSTRIRYQSDNSRFTGMLAALVARMSGGNLQSLAGLTGAADKGVMFTGPGTAGTFNLTPYARTVLDDANGGEMWATMGGTHSTGANSSFTRLPNSQGTILQRGTWWTGNGTDIVFPMAFPTAVRSVVAAIVGRTNAATPFVVNLGYESQTSFAAYTTNSVTGAVVQATIRWSAEGW